MRCTSIVIGEGGASGAVSVGGGATRGAKVVGGEVRSTAWNPTDAVPDGSVFPVERDPKTGGRRIEETAFEVADTGATAHATKKARKLAMRGVRRLFSARVEDRSVHAWQHDSGSWTG